MRKIIMGLFAWALLLVRPVCLSQRSDAMLARLAAATLLLVGLWFVALDVPAHHAKAEFNGCSAGFCNPSAASGGGGGSCNPPTLSCVTDPTGLVFWMPFDTSTTSGSTTNDLSGNARNGTLTGSPSLVAGKIQQGVSLNGTGQLVTITDGSPRESNAA